MGRFSNDWNCVTCDELQSKHNQYYDGKCESCFNESNLLVSVFQIGFDIAINSNVTDKDSEDLFNEINKLIGDYKNLKMVSVGVYNPISMTENYNEELNQLNEEL